MTAPERIWAYSDGLWIEAWDAPPSGAEYIRADLAAVTPDPNAGAVKVKPLVWEPVGNPNGRYRLHSTIAWARNTCPYGPYFIGLSSSCKNGEYSWDGPANTGKRGFADPESAKAAAQADYAARILAALETTPDPRDEVIARLVEENNWQIKARAQHWLRRTISAPEDAAVEEICEKYGYGAVMDAASRLWARKPYGSGAFYVGGCIGFKSDDEARAALAAAKTLTKETKE